MTKMAGAEADGFLVHPLNTVNSLRQLTLPALAEGRAQAGRDADAVQVVCQVIVGLAKDEAALERCRMMARSQLAFYSSTPAYKPILDCEGWGEMQPHLNRLSKEGKWEEMNAMLGDEMLEAMTVCGSPQEVAARLKAERGSLIQHLAPVVYTEDESLVAELVAELKSD